MRPLLLILGMAWLVCVAFAQHAAPPFSTPAGSRDRFSPTDAREIEPRVNAVYKEVSPAVIRVEWSGGGDDGGSTGVILSEDGLLLCSKFSSGSKLAVDLPDGRRASAAALGWSAEWNLGLAKLEGPGPWPHATLAEQGASAPGERFLTFGYPLTEFPAGRTPSPMLGIAAVRRLMPRGLVYDHRYGAFSRSGAEDCL